jgi:hypothetical protein
MVSPRYNDLCLQINIYIFFFLAQLAATQHELKATREAAQAGVVPPTGSVLKSSDRAAR